MADGTAIEWVEINGPPPPEMDGDYVLLYFPKGYWLTHSEYAVGFWSGEYQDWFECESDSRPMGAFDKPPSHYAVLEPPHGR